VTTLKAAATNGSRHIWNTLGPIVLGILLTVIAAIISPLGNIFSTSSANHVEIESLRKGQIDAKTEREKLDTKIEKMDDKIDVVGKDVVEIKANIRILRKEEQ